jgi:hypothetical protein
VCLVDTSGLVITIYEYELTWREGQNLSKDDLDNCDLKYIGKILVILQKPWDIVNQINFLPYYHPKNNSIIIGT